MNEYNQKIGHIIFLNVNRDIIQKRIRSYLKSNITLAKYQIGCSVGTTFMNRADNEITFFERADQALYRQKISVSKPLSIV